MSLTVIISHTKDFDFVEACLRNIKSLDVFKEAKIHLDGYGIPYSGAESADEITSHNLPHGERVHDLLETTLTDRCVFMDADFFCLDKELWTTALKNLDEFFLVSISRPWINSSLVPSTPFMVMNHREFLRLLPDRRAWNHFNFVWDPKSPVPLFDTMQYLFLILKHMNKSRCICSWYPLHGRKFKYYHFWDARDTVDANIAYFLDDSNKDLFNRYQFLAYSMNKLSFKYVLGKCCWSEFVSKYEMTHHLIDKMKDTSFKYQFSIVYDFILNFGESCILSFEQRERLNEVKRQFYAFGVDQALLLSL